MRCWFWVTGNTGHFGKSYHCQYLEQLSEFIFVDRAIPELTISFPVLILPIFRQLFRLNVCFETSEYSFVQRITWLYVIFWRRYEIRENNHAHSTATSVHSIKLKVSTKHFWRKTTIARQKATFWFKLSMKIKFWHTWRMIRLTPGALGEHLAHQPAFTHSQVFALSI